MSDFFVHPVYLSARAAIVAPERAIPVTLYATQKWLPRLGPERWCLVILLRSLCLDSQRRSDGTKRVACSWRQLAEMLDVHEETIASWLKHKPIPNDKPWRCIIPVDEKAEALGLFIPRLRYAYETRNGKTRRTGFLLEILMEDPVAPEDEAHLRQQIEMLQMQQGELGLETHRLTDHIGDNNSDLLQLSSKRYKQQISSSHYVNQSDPDLPSPANSSQLGLHNALVNPDNPGLQTGVKQENLGSDSYVNQSNEGSPGSKSEDFGKNVNELNTLIQQLKQNNYKRHLRRDLFQPVIELTETLLADSHSRAMFFKVLNVLYPERLDLYVAAVRVALDVAQAAPQVNRGAIFVRTLRDLAGQAGIDLGFRREVEERIASDSVGNPGSQQGKALPAPPLPPATGEAIWAETQLTLRRQMTQATYDAIIQRTFLLGYDDDHYVIGVRTEMAKEWLENRLYDIVQRTLSSVVGGPVTIAFKVIDSD